MTLEQRRAACFNLYQDFMFQGLLEVETVDLRAARGSEVESEARRSEAQQGSYASTHTNMYVCKRAGLCGPWHLCTSVSVGLPFCPVLSSSVCLSVGLETLNPRP